MTFIAPWLLAAACATGSATFVPADADVQGGSSSSSSGHGGAQPHQMGLGATFGLSARGGGASIRYFFNSRIGVDTRVLLASRPNSTGHSEGLTLQFAPSIIVMLTGPSTTSNVDVRPYVGGGISYTHAWADTPLGYPSADGMGEQVFGGVEIQFRSAGSFGLSVEVVHFFQASSLAGTTAPNGTTAVFAVHMYR